MANVRALPSLLAALLLLPACGGEPAPTRLRIGMNPWPGYAHLALARERGCFAAHGIDAQLVEFASLHDLRRGFAEGLIDVLPSTLVEVIALTRDGGRQPVVTWIADASRGSDVVVADRAAIADGWRGKAIAYEPATLGAYMLARFLAHVGVSADAVRAVGMDQAHMAAALAQGDVVAAVTYPPYDERMLARPGTTVVFTSAALPGEIIDTISLEKSLVDADPTLVARFQAAMADTHAFAQREPAITRGILQRVTGIHDAEFTAAMAGVVIYGPAEQRAWLASPHRLEQLAGAVATALGEPQPPRLWLPSPEHLAPCLAPAAPR